MKRLKIILQSKYLYICLFILGFIYYFVNTIIIKYDSIYINETDFNGIIEGYKIDGDKLTFTLSSKEKLIGNYYFKSEEEKNYYINNIRYGSNLDILGELGDFNNNTVFNTFNYKEYLYNKKIYRSINVKNININNDNISFINKLKNNISSRVDDIDSSGYIKTFIMGDKSLIEDSEIKSYKNLGVSHLFALSGMHITLFSSVILYILNKLKHNKNLSIIMSLIILFIYGLICSFPSSIIRAYTMYLLLSINKIFKLDIKTFYILILTIVINIFINPFILNDIGYRYSISTCFGLILLQDKLANNNYISSLFKVSLVAYLFSLPITINNNYEINLLTPINNIIIVPLVSLIVYPLSLITFVCPIVYPIFKMSCYILLFLISILSKINIFNIIIPRLSIVLILIYYLCLYLTLFKSNKYIILLILLLIFNKYIYCLDDCYYVVFFDVKQGDSSIIIYPRHKKVIMIDTGGKVENKREKWQEKKNKYYYTDNIILYLKSIGISKIDDIILSHGDEDHALETYHVIDNFKVNEVIFNCGPYNGLEKSIINKKVNFKSCIDNLENIKFLKTKIYNNENDNSNINYLTINNYNFLFMGDASKEAEKELINKYSLDIDVLKVGHHGSKTSSSKDFINDIKPKYSIISVGKNNRYGHPNKGVLDNLTDSRIYRTDENGSIMFKIKNNKLKIETCSP